MIDQSLMRPIENRSFCFACRKDLACFTRCCAKLDLILTPYDVIRLKKRLGLSSVEFLEKHTTDRIEPSYGLPAVKLKMNEDDAQRCPFVSPHGCNVYEDRPGACRIYPLGRAASKIREGDRAGEYYFMVRESHCLGFEDGRQWAVEEWIADQGLAEYNAMNDLFIDVTAGKHPDTLKSLGERRIQMFYTACYSVDAFRRFVFASTFLRRFEVAPDLIDRMEHDDVELMKFAFKWLRFALFGEKTPAAAPRDAETAHY